MSPEHHQTGPSRRPAAARHVPLLPGQSRAACLKALRRLSAFLDEDLPFDICKEIRHHLKACPNCELFLASLKQTISLCRHSRYERLAPAVKARLRAEIFKAAARL
jgi:hypothetical protein